MNVRELIDDLSPLLNERRGYKPGTVRSWGGVDYEKQRNGKWRRVGKSAKKRWTGSKKQHQAKAHKALDTAAASAMKSVSLGILKKKIDAKLPKPPPFERHVQIAQQELAKHQGSLHAKLDKLRALAPAGAVVKGRTKELESAVGKIARKPQYGTAANLQDLTGTRVSTNTQAEALDVVAKIEKEFEIVDKDDYLTPLGDRKFADDDDRKKHEGVMSSGYRSVHFVAKDEAGLEFEIQVRTKNQSTWADWAHDVYKPRNKTEEDAIEAYGQVLNDYSSLMSAYYQSKDDPSIPNMEPPPCPAVVLATFGCME